MMRVIVFTYWFVFGAYFIVTHSAITSAIYNGIEGVTASATTTETSSSIYMITNFNPTITTTEFISLADETTGLPYTDQIISETSLTSVATTASIPPTQFMTTRRPSAIFVVTNTFATTASTLGTEPAMVDTTTTTVFLTRNTTTTLTSLFFTTAPSCTASQVQVSTNFCLPENELQNYTINILRNRTGDAMLIAHALSLYISSVTNTNISSNSAYTYILSPSEIEEYLSSINNVTLSITSNTSLITAQPIHPQANVTAVGAFYIHNVGGQVINSSNENDIFNSNITAGAIIRNELLVDATFLSMLIIDKPMTYENIDNSSDQTLASSVIVVSMHENSSSSILTNISLYFQVSNDYTPTYEPNYSCAFYNLNRSQWDASNCTKSMFNRGFNRYECSCNHLSTFALVWSPNMMPCHPYTEVKWINGTCLFITDAQNLIFATLKNSTNSTLIATILSLYITSITDPSISPASTPGLSLGEIDRYLRSLDNVTLTISNKDSFLMAQPINQSSNVIVLGASFISHMGGALISSNNTDSINSPSVSAAAMIGNESLTGVTSLKMLIIDTPWAFRNIDNSTNKTLASSIILASVKRNNSTSTSMNISLYFRVLDGWQANISDVSYYCSFYDTTNLQWNESGCTTPTLNTQFNRYECSCNHLTSFALIWLPNVPLTRNLDAQDIASIVFESISIVCFVCIIVHAIIIRLYDSRMTLRAYDLLPLVSCASTTILFIFHIALGMTAYTRTSSENQTQCFLSSSVLMFFVYFFLIFMFCTKTSVGYFNYLRFVRLFPQPPLRNLRIMLMISFLISIAWVSFAAGLDSHPSYKITQLYPYKLCWFTRDVIYYFLTIPVCLFLFINIVLLIFVGAHIINHVRHATSPHQSYERMKRCVIVLVSSCVTQGIGWFFGPFLTFAVPQAAVVLSWIFVILNGLEGLWAILLYLIIRSQNMDEQKHVKAARQWRRPMIATFRKYKKWSKDDDESESETNDRSPQSESSQLSDTGLRENTTKTSQ